MQTLIEFTGGPAAFESRLDYIFQPGTSEQDLGVNGAGITSIMVRDRRIQPNAMSETHC
jgi:hypothetical protein